MSSSIKLPPLQIKPRPVKAKPQTLGKTRTMIVPELLKAGGPKPRFATVARFATVDETD